MATFAFIGLSMYVFINKNPQQSQNLVKNATDFIKYMPMDSNTSDLLTPLFDFTNAQDKMSHFRQQNIQMNLSPQQKRMMHSGGNSSKRCVSETKKKYVASSQGWKCATCAKTT